MRALALFSGGLDSLLAIKVIQEQGIEVIALNFDTGFASVRDKKIQLERVLSQIGAKLQIINLQNTFIKTTLFSPKYGYGKNFNPCIDCHAKMIEVTKELLSEFDAKFIISGEVLGQRPMSQTSRALKSVSSLSDEGGLLLRPLSAKLLPKTIPENEGWVDREKLLDISGRGRTKQINLAKKFEIDEYESPSGGCLLTDENFSLKLKDFIKYDKNFLVEDIEVLKYGRHLRLPEGAKLIIGRHEEENNYIQEIKNSKFDLAYAIDVNGPTALVSKNATKGEKILSAKLILTYAKTDENKEYEVKIANEIIKEIKLKSKDMAREYFL